VPLYEYKCRKCHHRFEEIQKFAARPITKCPKCHAGKVEKLISAPAVHFKGTGWYVTDYGGKGKADKADKGDKGEASDTGGKGDKGDKGDKSDKSEKSDKGGKESKAETGKKRSGKD